ncbi:MAG: RNA polymerase sigma-70 factor [Bacteroidales bacterium]|nr:RNA polymerase sigma-70 factor [Bacteroidales bacterium]
MQEITQKIVQGIINSDPRCFRTLYDAYYSYLCGLAVSYIHDFEEAQELVNDVFLRVWERRALLKHPPLPYLISGVRNACFNYLRDNKKASEVTLSILERIPDVALYDENEVEDIVRMISDLSSQLPKRCYEVFNLHFDEGLDTADIAKKLGLSPSTVRVQLKLAIDKIREKLKI